MGAALALLLAASAAAGTWDARLSAFEGDVELKAAAGSSWKRATEPVPLERGDEVRVGARGFAEVSLGAEGLVRLEPGSHLQFSDLDQRSSSLTLRAGVLLQKLKSLKRLRGRLSVRTGSAVCAVRGTEFAVKVAADGATTAGVFDEGEIELAYGEARHRLGPGQEAGADGPRPLSELAPYRAKMRLLNKRLAALSRRYRALPLEKKRRLREALER